MNSHGSPAKWLNCSLIELIFNRFAGVKPGAPTPPGRDPGLFIIDPKKVGKFGSRFVIWGIFVKSGGALIYYTLVNEE